METVKEYCDLKIYPQDDQISNIRNCLDLSTNVIRELKKLASETDSDEMIVAKSRQIVKKFLNRGNHHLSRLAMSTIIGSLAQYRFNCQISENEKNKLNFGFSAEFILNDGLCCLFTKEPGEALLVNNLLLLPTLGTIPIECPWEHCFNKITFMFIYRLGETYRARIYSSWPFEKPQKQDDAWLGVNLGKHKLVFLSNGSSFSYYHLLNDRKNKNLVFKKLDAFMYYDEIFKKIKASRLTGIIILGSQIPVELPTTLSTLEKYHFLIFLLSKVSAANLKVRISKEKQINCHNDFEKANVIRHSKNTQEINDIDGLVNSLRQNLTNSAQGVNDFLTTLNY